VWIYFLAIPVYGEYLETLTIYSLVQLVGFIILLQGVLIYNEIIILKFWGLANFTKERLLHKNCEQESIKFPIRQSLN
jgi:hypothetical protein